MGTTESHNLKAVSKALNPTRRFAQGIAAFLIYLAISLLFFGLPLAGHFSNYYLGRDADPPQMMWLLQWWPFAIRHHLNPFLTDYVWAPVGFNFAWMTSTPLAAIVAAPLTKAVGLVSSLNILTILGAPTAAFSTFVLCKRVSHSFWPSIFGGFVFGFSSYMMGQTLGHLNLVLVFPIPLAVYLVVRWFEGSLRARSFVALLALTLVSEFLLDMEVLAMATLIAGVTLAIAIRYSPRSSRARLLQLIPLLAVAYGITTIVVSPYLYYFLALGSVHQSFWPSERFSTDLLNFILPTPVNLGGTFRWLANISSKFPGTLTEQNGFIALPLIAITIAWARNHWAEPFCRAILISTIVVVVAALGPYLQIAGQPLIPMPWLLLTHAPLLHHALPSRLMVFPPLAIAVIVSLWLSNPENNAKIKALATSFTLMLMIPNPSPQFWITRIDTPAFFTDGVARRALTRNDVVLTLPWGSTGNSMLWQAECGMCFRNVSGYTAMERFEVRRWPIVNYFLGARDLPEQELQLKAFLANTGVTAIIVDDAKPSALAWKDLLASLGVEPRNISGVSLYRIPANFLAGYRRSEMSGAQMERRAMRLRLEAVVNATDRFLNAGYDSTHLDIDELVNLALLPPSWRSDPGAFFDLKVMPGRDRGALILALGSKTALTDTMQRFGADADAIYLPFPRIVASSGDGSPIARAFHNALLPPAAMPIDGESMQFLGMGFDPAHLHKIVSELSIEHSQELLDGFARR
jgi:hypothetical protein